MFAKDTLPRLPISFRIIHVSNLTYKALQEMGASLTPSRPPNNPILIILLPSPFPLPYSAINTGPLAALQFLQLDNHALISRPFAWNTLFTSWPYPLT